MRQDITNAPLTNDVFVFHANVNGEIIWNLCKRYLPSIILSLKFNIFSSVQQVLAKLFVPCFLHVYNIVFVTFLQKYYFLVHYPRLCKGSIIRHTFLEFAVHDTQVCK